MNLVDEITLENMRLYMKSLGDRVEALERRVEPVDKSETPTKSYSFDIPGSTLGKVAEAIKPTREEVIEDAKGIIKSYIDDDLHLPDLIPRRKAAFFYNRKKGKLTCVIWDIHSNRVIGVGRSKCAKGDCFNLYIGKVITLYRALYVDVPYEFINARQPAKAKVGDVVRINNMDFNVIDDKHWIPGFCKHISEVTSNFEIIDDTGDWGGRKRDFAHD